MRSLLPYLLCLTLLLAGCQEPPPQLPLLQVGSRQISLKQFQRELHISYPEAQNWSESERQLLHKQLVNRLVERELVLAEAGRLGVQLTPDEIDQTRIALRGDLSEAEFAERLQSAGQTRQSWNDALKLQLLTEKISKQLLAAQPPVTAAEVAADYRKHRQEYRRPAELRARQMLLADIETAEQMLLRLRDGESFAELARNNSLSPDREEGGNLGYFSRGQLPVEFDEVLFNLTIGEVSAPVQSPYGVHLFLVERRRRAGIRPLAVVRDEIFARLTQQREEAMFQNWLEGLRARSEVRINWQLLTQSGEN